MSSTAFSHNTLPEEAGDLLQRAKAIAMQFDQKNYSVAHLLLVLCGLPEGIRCISDLSGSAETIRSYLEMSFLDEVIRLDPRNSLASSGIEPRDDGSIRKFCDLMREGLPSAAAAEGGDVIARAVMAIAQASSGCALAEKALRRGGLQSLLPDDEIPFLNEPLSGSRTSQDMLDELLEEDEIEARARAGSALEAFLHKRNARKDDIGSEHAGAPAAPPAGQVRPAMQTGNKQGARAAEETPEEALRRAMRDLSECAAQGTLDPVVGRDLEIAHILSALRRRRKSSVILHGDAGVGKTAIAEGVAMALRGPGIEPELARRPFYEVSLTELVAGTKFRGDFEARMSKLIEKASGEKAILFIDEIHMLMGSGSTYGRGMDGANILKPALARGALTVIGATTSLEARVMRTDRALMRRFDMILVAEPSREETIEILTRSAWSYEAHHGIRVTPEAIDAIVQLSGDYLPDRRFPDKAFDLLDMASVVAREDGGSARLELGHVREGAGRLGVRLPGPPSPQIRRALARMESEMKEMVSEADVGPILSGLRMAWIGGDSAGRRGCWIVNGPDQDRRRAFCETVARGLCLPMVRIDVSRVKDRLMIGLLTGYGQRNGGMESQGDLIDVGDEHDACVLLLDGIDRCDAVVQEVVLEMLSQGCLKTFDGRSVRMSGAWVFLGVDCGGPENRSIGFGTLARDDRSERLARVFLPELLSRSCGSVHLAGNDTDDLDVLLREEIRLASDGLLVPGFHVHLDENAREHVRAMAIRETTPAEMRKALRNGLSLEIADLLFREDLRGLSGDIHCKMVGGRLVLA